MMEVEEHSIDEEMKKLSLEEATSELRSLKEKHERQEIILSHWKNHANDLSDRLQRIANSSDSSKSIFDVFADKGVERIIETLAIENNEMHEYFNKYNPTKENTKMGAFEMSKLIKQLEEENKHLKKVLEDHYKQIRTLTDAINCKDENVMQKKFSKQEQKLMIYKQENQKLKSYVFLQDTLMKSLKKDFNEIKRELYHVFKDLCLQYGSNLGKELEKISKKDNAKEALEKLLHPVTESSKLPMGLQPKPITEPMPGEYKPDPARDTFESGYGSLTDQDRALYEEISKTKIENNNLKSEMEQCRVEKLELANEIKLAKHKANEAELNLKQFLEQNNELHKKLGEKEKIINEHENICPLLQQRHTSVFTPRLSLACSSTSQRYPPHRPHGPFSTPHWQSPQMIMARDGALPLDTQRHERYPSNFDNYRDNYQRSSEMRMSDSRVYRLDRPTPSTTDEFDFTVRDPLPRDRRLPTPSLGRPYIPETIDVMDVENRRKCESCGKTFESENEKLTHYYGQCSGGFT